MFTIAGKSPFSGGHARPTVEFSIPKSPEGMGNLQEDYGTGIGEIWERDETFWGTNWNKWGNGGQIFGFCWIKDG